MKKRLNQLISLAKSRTARDTYLVFIGNSLAGFIGMLLMIFISRRLGPEEFGIFSVSFSLVALLAKFADAGLNFAMVKNISQSRAKQQPERIRRIFETVLTAKIATSVVIAGAGLILADFISTTFFGSAHLAGLNRLLMVGFFAIVFYDSLRVYFQANKRFLTSTLIYIVVNLIKLVIIGLLVVLWPDFKQFIAIYLIAPLLAGLVFFRTIKQRIRLRFDRQEFKRLVKFASWMAVSVILAAVGENLNVLMVSARLSSFQAGIYSAAEKFILPFAIFAGALGTVLISRTSEFLEMSHIKKFISKLVWVQLLFVVLILVIFPFTPLLPILLGSSYQPSVGVLQILLLACLFRLVITPLNSVFYPLEKSFIFALDSLIRVVFLVGLNWQLLPRLQARGAAISLTVAELVILLVNYGYLFLVLKKKSAALTEKTPIGQSLAGEAGKL